MSVSRTTERGAVAISAPGKVLLAGGYLVLDRDYTGLVFGLDARIHVHVQTLPTCTGVILSEIIVRSPQFRDAEWRYGYRLTENDGGIQVTQLKGHSTYSQSRNRFVETALAYALTYVSSLSHTSIEPASITILADADYYSCAEHVSSSARKRFPDFNVPLNQAHKTGLGSSAALVTALTAAVLSHYLPPAVLSFESESGRTRLHNLAQAAHCSAQGKVGSGFDIAAAVYGSCIYKRFSPSLLEDLSEVGTQGFSSHLRSLIEGTNPMKHWDTQINKSAVRVPKGLKLLMCDVDCGSETVGMVKNVLNWRKDDPEDAALLWAALQKGNEDLAGELRRLASLPEHSVKDYEDLRVIILTIRSLIREMSEKARVPIEPRAQTNLLDACSKLPGVIGGVVPGAGGFDAIALLVEDKDEVISKLHSFLDTYKVNATEEGGAGMGKVRLLRVKQEMQGIKAEDLELYSDWSR